MKKQGTIVRWDAARGYGFLRSPDTPADVFFHVRDWVGGSERPAEGLAVRYEEIHVGGKGPRGMAVRPLARESARIAPPMRQATRRSPPRGAGVADGPAAPFLALIAGYAALLGWGVATGRLPVVSPFAALLLNVATFFAYWFDKHAAQRGAWRTSEQTLHAFGLLGGWPGAWFAHRVLRHKSRKPTFRAGYRATVAVHCGALLAWLFIPRGM